MTFTVSVKVGDKFVQAADEFKTLRAAKDECKILYSGAQYPGVTLRIEDSTDPIRYWEGTLYSTFAYRNKVWKLWARWIPSLFTQELVVDVVRSVVYAEIEAVHHSRRFVSIQAHRDGVAWAKEHRV